MREILFRGKRTDNGEWVESISIHYPQSTNYKGTCWLNGWHERANDWINVDPATVGQFTGLVDKHGKRIFQGDILRIAKAMDGWGGYNYPPIEYPKNALVKWDLCAWMWEINGECTFYIHFPDAWCHYECEVIGNIHDNPELLKGGDTDGKERTE